MADDGGIHAGVGDSVLDRIRTEIIFGALAPGQRLTLDRLKARYAVSITTLRESLNRLVSEGFVVAEDNKGFRVVDVSEQDLREIAELRLLLESHALERSFAQGDLDWEGRVIAAHHKLATIEKRLVNGEEADQMAWKRYDWEFHQALISGCGSATLIRMHANVFDRYLRYQIQAMSFRGALAADEHAKFAACAMQRDVAGARALLDQHVAGGVAVALKSPLLA